MFAQSGLRFTSARHQAGIRWRGTTNAIGSIHDAAATGEVWRKRFAAEDWGIVGTGSRFRSVISVLPAAWQAHWAFEAISRDCSGAGSFRVCGRQRSVGKVALELGDLYRLPVWNTPGPAVLPAATERPRREDAIRSLDQNVVLDKPFGIITETMENCLSVIDNQLRHISRSKASELVRDGNAGVFAARQRGLFLNEQGSMTAGDLLNDLENLIPAQR